MKQIVNVIQLASASHAMAEQDAEERNKTNKK
jgi:hypothetical protein